MSTVSAEILDRTFAVLEAAAVAVARCPMNGTHGIKDKIVTALARQGRIKVLISGRNYRTVEILVGPNAGKSTAPDPSGSAIWKVGDKTATRINGRILQPPRKRTPLPMTRAERDRRDALMKADAK